MTEYMPDGTPITVERVEQALDCLAEIMIVLGPTEGPACLPLYRRLKDEITKLKADDEAMAEVRERVRLLDKKRGKDRKRKLSPE